MSLPPTPAADPADRRWEQALAGGSSALEHADRGEAATVAAITQDLLGLLGEPETSLAEALERICAAVEVRIGPCRTSASLRTPDGWELVCARGLRPQE